MLGAIIGAGASLASSLFGNKQADKSAKMNIAHQKEFAQKGVQWKVKDAKQAGIHPLAALGAQTHSFSPVSVGHDYSGLASAGQDLGRAIDATRTKSGKLDAYTAETQRLTVQRMGLENELLASKIARVKQPASPPAMPTGNPNENLIPGQGDSPGIENKPMERQGWKADDPGSEAGAVSDTGYAHSTIGHGGYAPIMSKDVKDRSDDDTPGVIAWNIRNRLPQMFQSSLNPPFRAPIGSHWIFNPFKMRYELRRTKVMGDYIDHPARTGGPYR